MKKLLIFALAAALALSCFAFASFADGELPEGAEPYPFAEGANIGAWLASVAQDGDGWIAVSEDSYVAATFKATKAFSAFLVPFWAGNPDNFAGITPVDVEFAIFKAVDGNYGSDYNSDDAIVKEVFTFKADNPNGILWQFNQIPKGKYCFRIRQLTEEGGYFVAAPHFSDSVQSQSELIGPIARQICLPLDDGISHPLRIFLHTTASLFYDKSI